jgi:C-terminal processing protease CtpA/Prc
MTTLSFVQAIEPNDLVKKLGSDDFKVRSTGFDELKKWSSQNQGEALPLLHSEMLSTSDPEVSLRLNQILRGIVLHEHFGRPTGFIGVELDSDLIEIKGQKVPVVVVRRVVPDSAAAEHGLKAGDTIASLDGQRMSMHEVRNARNVAQVFILKVSKKFAGDVIKLGLLKDGAEQELVLKLGERPDNLPGTKPRASKAEMDAYYEKWLQEQKLKQP